MEYCTEENRDVALSWTRTSVNGLFHAVVIGRFPGLKPEPIYSATFLHSGSLSSSLYGILKDWDASFMQTLDSFYGMNCNENKTESVPLIRTTLEMC